MLEEFPIRKIGHASLLYKEAVSELVTGPVRIGLSGVGRGETAF